MKRLILAAAALAVPMFASATEAATISFGGLEGQVFIKYRNLDSGKLYSTANASTVGEANVDAIQVAPAGALPGAFNTSEDLWGVAIVDEIRIGGQFGTLVYQNGNAALQGNTQVTGIFYGGRDIQVDNNANGSQTIYSRDISLDFFASVKGNNADGIDFPAIPDAAARTNPGGVPDFDGVTDGTHIFSFVSHYGSLLANANASFTATIDPNLIPNQSGVIGGGSLFLDLGTTAFGTGIQNDLFKPSATGEDALVTFTTLSPPPNTLNWTVGSNDPLIAQAAPVPTPTAFAGASLLMGGMMFGSMRRRKA